MEENSAVIQNSGVDYSGKSLSEILNLFKEMLDRNDQQELYKNAEPVKAAFYKVLRKEKIAIGGIVEVGKAAETEVAGNPFIEVENAFKDLFEQYKVLRDEHRKEVSDQKEDNYKQKLDIIEQINALVEKGDDSNIGQVFKELQTKWKSLGVVPQEKAKEVDNLYKKTLEKFYDNINISNEFRDYDFRKNLEAKTHLCEKAEALVNEKDVVGAFNELQKLHEEWKSLGPVAKSERENIWERFKSATSVINKKHQDHYDKLKVQQKANLERKSELCEKAELIANSIDEQTKDWNKLSKQIEALQAEWKTIGFASKKDNQKIYDRFRAACDKFFTAKRGYYSNFKDVLEENLKKKEDLCLQAEELKTSTDWKVATDKIINLQRVWKQIGPVTRKQSDLIWKRFRAACDEFFENKAKHFSSESENYAQNLEAKKAVIEEIKGYIPKNQEDDSVAYNDFIAKWNKIGFVPISEKSAINKEFDEAMNIHFSQFRDKNSERKMGRIAKMISDVKSSGKGDRGVRMEREKLLMKFRKLQNEIATLENNMGFFAKSKNADALIADIQKSIEEYKSQLSQIEQQIKSIDKELADE